MKILHIKFIDTAISADWYSEREIESLPLDDLIIEAVGFLVKETDDFIAIAPIMDKGSKSGRCKGLVQIPKGAIKKRIVLKMEK